MSTQRPKVGVSSCLLGAAVRFNGSHVRHEYVSGELSQLVEFVPVCPEVAMGLSVPREPLRLVGDGAGGQSLVTSATGVEWTRQARATADQLVRELPADLDGFILTSKSPMCGPERVKVYNRAGIPDPSGVGLFARAVGAAFPDIPVIDAGRLHDANERFAFLLRLYALAGLRHIEPTVAGLQRFHREHKFMLMAFQPAGLTRLGRIAAGVRRSGIKQALIEYRAELARTLAQPLKPGRVSNALQHMYGYIKDTVGESQRALLLAAIAGFRHGRVRLDVPLSVLEFAADGSGYLAAQTLLGMRRHA